MFKQECSNVIMNKSNVKYLVLIIILFILTHDRISSNAQQSINVHTFPLIDRIKYPEPIQDRHPVQSEQVKFE